MSRRVVWLLTVRELRLLARDAHGLAVLFIMPTIFILVMSMALQRTFGDGPALSLAVDDRAQTPASKALAQRLGEHAAVALGAEGSADARLVIPADFEQRVAGKRGDAPVLLLEVATRVPAHVRSLLQVAARQTLGTLLLEEALGLADSGARLSRLPVEVQVMDGAGRGVRLPSAVQQNVPAWLVFGMFFAVIPLSGTVIRDRERGLLARFRAMGIGSLPLLSSRLLAYGLVNLVQAAAMLAVGFWLVPLLGGEPLSVLGQPAWLFYVVPATSVAAVGFALWVAMASRTQLQAVAAGGAATILFAAVGGVMVPAFVMPPVMQGLSRLSPLNWALEGLIGTITGTATPPLIVATGAGLAAVGGLCLLAAGRAFRRLEQ